MAFFWDVLYNSAEELLSISTSSFKALLYSIFSWYTTKDLVEDIEESLETYNLDEKVLPLISLNLLGEYPAIISISV